MDHSNYDKITEKIHRFLDNHTIKNGDIIVFDIDDTLLCPQKNQLIPSVANVYYKCVIRKIPIVLITARQECPYTEKQLTELGLTHHVSIFFMPNRWDNVYEYKLKTRKMLVDMGYNIICSIGDMSWDSGDYGGESFVLTDQ